MVLFLAEQAGPMREATSFRRHIGGAESNLAIGLARLRRSAGWISRLGDDEFGQMILFRLRGEGVDVSQVVIDPTAPTGVFFRERREAGPMEVLYYRCGSAASRLSPADLDEEYIRGAKMLHLTGITPALSDSCRETVYAAAEIARAAKVPTTFDPNLRLKLWSAAEARPILRDILARCDIVLTSLEEAELLTGEPEPGRAAANLLTLGPRLVVLKLGAGGAIAFDNSGSTVSPALPVDRVVDPIGAGDAFDAGFVAGQLNGLSLEESLRIANRCGSLAVVVPGDVEGLPTWDEVVGDVNPADVRR